MRGDMHHGDISYQ